MFFVDDLRHEADGQGVVINTEEAINTKFYYLVLCNHSFLEAFVVAYLMRRRDFCPVSCSCFCYGKKKK